MCSYNFLKYVRSSFSKIVAPSQSIIGLHLKDRQCLAMADFLVWFSLQASWCSLRRTSRSRMVSPMYMDEQVALK